MLIYNKEWIDNLDIRQKAYSWLKKNFISEAEYGDVLKNYPTGYHESNIFARIGMFLFTLIVISSGVGIINLMFLSSIEHAFSFQCVILGIIYYFIAGHFIKQKNHFRSGVTDALIYSSVFSVSIGLLIIVDGNNFNFNLDPIVYIIFVLPFLIFTSLRFADSFLALLSFAGIFILNVLLVLKLGNTGKLILPFEGMIFSLLIYLVVKKQKSKDENRFLKKCIVTIESASLVTLYLSGNYYVVREMTEMLPGGTITPGGDIPFAFFFYAYTVAVPLLFVWLGLRRKDYVLIRLGLLLEVIGVLSIRYYYSFLPPETAMILAGIFLVLVAWFSIRYLKTPKHGISYLADDADEEAMENIGAIITSRVVSQTMHADHGTKFGGGSSGGGGAGSDF